MADFEYVDVNGRQIRVRPRENAQEIDEYGNFHRQPNRFTEGFGEGKNPVEKDRYILFWAKGCNWSNRAAIARELLGLEDAVKVEIVDWTDREENLGWEFVNSPDHINPETGAQFLSELYYNADEEYTGRTTVPAFVDYKTKKVVNNDYHWLTNHLETAFRPFHKKGAPDLYPEELRPEIDKLNKWLFENVNNAVYRAQFAESLQAFADGYETFFAGLDAMEERLADKRFLFGDYVTDSDIRLYTTIARLDVSYSRNIGPCKHRLVDYPNLWGSDSGKTVIKAATGANAKPYVYVGDDDKPAGYDVDVLNAVFDKLPDYELEYEVTDFGSVLSGLNSGNYQIGVNNFSYNEDRGASYLYSYPYDKISYVFVTKKGGKEIKSFEDAAGLSFEGGTGISVSNAVEAWNEKNPDKAINITYSDADTSVFLQHVADGSQDFTIIDLAMYNSYMEEFNYDVQKNDIPEDEAKMIAENSYAYYIFPQDQKDLREQVDKALKELKEDGTLTEISKKWYGQDAAPEDDKFEETIN